MTHPSKRKGVAYETEITKDFQEIGCAAEKVPLSGAVKTNKFDHDVTAPIMGADRKIECKIRKDGYRELYKHLAENDILAHRSNNRSSLVTMRLDFFLQVLRRANNDYARDEQRLAELARAAGMVS